MKKKTGFLEKDFDCIMLIAIADSTVQDIMNNIKNDKINEKVWNMRDYLCIKLIEHANECYTAQCNDKSSLKNTGTFYKIKNATEMRDTLYQFMRHWASSILQKGFKDIYNELPKGYGWDR